MPVIEICSSTTKIIVLLEEITKELPFNINDVLAGVFEHIAKQLLKNTRDSAQLVMLQSIMNQAVITALEERNLLCFQNGSNQDERIK